MKKEEIIEELGQLANIHLEDVFYSDFLQADGIAVMYDLEVANPEVLYEELENSGVTKEQLEKAIDDDTLVDFVEDWLNDIIDWSKTADEYGFVGEQTNDFF